MRALCRRIVGITTAALLFDFNSNRGVVAASLWEAPRVAQRRCYRSAGRAGGLVSAKVDGGARM
jgi:hypothetical protein